MRRLLVAAALLATSAARAQDGVHTHDGFYLGLELGPGHFATGLDGPAGRLEFSGVASQLGVAVGLAVQENLIFAAHLWGVSASDPDVEVDGESVGDVPEAAGISALGLNVTHYFMPANAYLSVTPSVTIQRVDRDEGADGSTERGFGMRFAVGKEWWVSADWALGVNAQFVFSRNEDQGTNPPTAMARWFGATFSATFN